MLLNAIMTMDVITQKTLNLFADTLLFTQIKMNKSACLLHWIVSVRCVIFWLTSCTSPKCKNNVCFQRISSSVIGQANKQPASNSHHWLSQCSNSRWSVCLGNLFKNSHCLYNSMWWRDKKAQILTHNKNSNK